jgi:hypothetical protein
MTITLRDLSARVHRLERLTISLFHELTATLTGHDLLLYVERREYMAALQDTLSDVEGARVVLAKACRRLSTSR